MFMKLAKLLGVGKSFFGNGEPAAYHLNKRASLPKFNEGRNPFAPKPPEAASAQPGAENKVRAPEVAPAPALKAPTKSAAKPVRGGWTTKLNPFRTPEPTAPLLPFAVQPELSLDAVKVVHNDLADADVDVVPVKSRAEAPAAAPVLPPARQAWEYLGESLLKSS